MEVEKLGGIKMTILTSLKSSPVFLLLSLPCVAAIVDEREQPPLLLLLPKIAERMGEKKNTIGHWASARWHGGSQDHWKEGLRPRLGETIVVV